MILFVERVPGGYICRYSYPTYITYCRNSDINPMNCYEVKQLIYYFIEDEGLDPSKLDFSKPVRDFVHSSNRYLKNNFKKNLIKFER